MNKVNANIGSNANLARGLGFVLANNSIPSPSLDEALCRGEERRKILELLAKYQDSTEYRFAPVAVLFEKLYHEQCREHVGWVNAPIRTESQLHQKANESFSMSGDLAVCSLLDLC